MQSYRVNQFSIDILLSWIKSGQVAIPEMQRPFVWTSTKVRDLIDSLYRGYPIGYIVTWKSQSAPVKGGGTADFQTIIIDGQQRITAMQAAIVGDPVVNNKFKKKRIAIAFNPQTEEFATATPVIRKQQDWLPDISETINTESFMAVMNDYYEKNPDCDQKVVESSIQKLFAIKNAQVGVIELDNSLELEEVTDIFIRINSKGVVLSTADFVMSKISAYGLRGRNIRKQIDYFSHLATNPNAYAHIHNDDEFVESGKLSRIEWLKDDADDYYDPSYTDIIRVVGLLGFGRGKLSGVVSMLSGLDPETREFKSGLIDEAYDRFESSLDFLVKKYQMKQFVILMQSTGYLNSGMLTSRNAVNFAYALFLKLSEDKELNDFQRRKVVRRWFVLSMLTERGSGSFETRFERDFREFDRLGAEEYLLRTEESELSDAFWNVTLPQKLETARSNSPFFKAFQASQVFSGSPAFLSSNVSIRLLLEQQGDIHHLLPKKYLQEHGINSQHEYNQVANYAFTETPINIYIGKRPPSEYMQEVIDQIESGVNTLGEIGSLEELEKNLRHNAIPEDFASVSVEQYGQFLERRRKLMAAGIRRYYYSL